MGVPSEKAASAAATILQEALYLNQMDPSDIYGVTRNDLLHALTLIERAIWADKREVG